MFEHDVLGELYAETVRYTQRHNDIDEPTARTQVREAVRYLTLVSAHPQALGGLFLPVEQQIDEVWHYLILQTREYTDLCENRLPGGHFIHHRSISYGDYGDRQSRETMLEQSLRWIPLYCGRFGDFDAEGARWWTMVRFLHEEMGYGLAEISALAPADATESR
ncbi:hypothetical protein [Nocardia pseudobrasiliensis]|uniref:Uncharacterized protein n=1 Tax=Nocardia pseudobrasiliensis TaxID=45979 RepID=A0A370ICU8_9NOCA|nr:hypothetical protein [Nocardia pseudobrasiliensis]RDI67921.1 hypothetical protein DFR76_102322 [Nocardia pseudobrasiliensis]